MPAAYYDENGNRVKQCTKCKKVQPVEEYYKHKEGVTADGLQPRCRHCTLAKYRDQNQRRAKKRKQKTHKLNEAHIKWIKEQQGKLSTRQVAKAFSKRFWAMKVTNSTVHRIFTGQIHAAPNKKDETLSVYDLLEQAQSYTGSVEDYIEEIDTKKVRF